MSESIKVGVIGVGVLGRHHARLYRQVAGAELAGVYDIDADRAEQVATELGTKPYTDMFALADQVEALSIAVPTHLHFEVSKDMLARGKHLLIEKPLTATLEDARELLKIAAAASRVLQVGHVERFNPVISFLERVLDNPGFIESHRLAPYPPQRPGLPPRGTEVGVVLDLMIHDIDLVLNLVRSPVTSIDAVGIPILSPTEDIANARIKFANGSVANLTASRVTPEPMRKIRLFQSNCYLSMDYMARTGELYVREGNAIKRQSLEIDDHNALLKELEHFVDCVCEYNKSGKVPVPKVSGEHAMRALEVAVEIGKQMKSGDSFPFSSGA